VTAHEISRRHCRIRVRGRQVTVCDLGSANGTYVNGQLVTGEWVLYSGDQLQVGPVAFLLEFGAGHPVRDARVCVPLEAASGEAAEAIMVHDEPGGARIPEAIPLAINGAALLPPTPVTQHLSARGQPPFTPPDEELPYAEPDDDVPFAEVDEG
jgi:pSer/pThr/pTyr-binding forkhead associated (FHA) protein